MRPPLSAASSSKRRMRAFSSIGWTSLTILSVLAASPEPVVKMATLSTCCMQQLIRRPRPTNPANASAALRRSRRLALAAQSAAGTGKDPRAGQAGRAVPNPPPVATASSNASGVEPAAPAGAAARIPAARPDDRARSPNDPAAWGDAARSPTTGKNLEDHPALATDTSAARRRFSARIRALRNSRRAVEPFAIRPDLFLPGTLHHSGNRPAPPSEHTPLERRSAF